MDQVIKSILTMNDTSAIIRILLVLATLGLSAYLTFKAKKIKIDNARSEEAKDNIESKVETIESNKKETEQIQTDSKKADDFLTKRKKKNK